MENPFALAQTIALAVQIASAAFLAFLAADLLRKRFHLRWRSFHIPIQVKLDQVVHTCANGQILIGDPPKDISDQVVVEHGEALINTRADFRWRRRFGTVTVARQPISCCGVVLEATEGEQLHILSQGADLDDLVDRYVRSQAEPGSDFRPRSSWENKP